MLIRHNIAESIKGCQEHTILRGCNDNELNDEFTITASGKRVNYLQYKYFSYAWNVNALLNWQFPI